MIIALSTKLKMSDRVTGQNMAVRDPSYSPEVEFVQRAGCKTPELMGFHGLFSHYSLTSRVAFDSQSLILVNSPFCGFSFPRPEYPKCDSGN